MALTNFQRQPVKQMLEDEETFATTLFFLLLDTYGTDMLDWDPDTLWIEVAGDFGATMPEVNRDKVQALISFYTTNLFQTSVEMFISTCNVLSGAEANFSVFDPADPEEMLWALYELSLHADSAKELLASLDPEILNYMGVTLNEYGVLDPPDLLRIAIMPNIPGIEQFSDDPLMYNGLWDMQEQEKTELVRHAKAKLRSLIDELDRIPISTKGDAWKAFKQKVMQAT